MKYRQWLTEWLETTVKPFKKIKTYKKYNDIVKKILIPQLGEYEIALLTVSVLQNFTVDLTEKYSANTVNGIISVLKNSLQRAEKTGVIEKQYSNCVQYPRSEEREIESFSIIEQRQIEQYVLKHKNYKHYGILVCLYTGLRIGELMALKWDDIDFKKGLITISKTCQDNWENGKYKKIIGSPKTKSSKRIIPVPQALIPHMREMKKHSKSNYVISGCDGKEISIRSYQRTFELLQNHLKIPHKGFHSLRHTFATRAIECGMDVKTLSEILGHNNPAITLKRYVHSFMEHKCAMMNKLGKNLKQE